MSAVQILLLLVTGLIIFQVIRKFLLIRSITHYSPSEAFQRLKNKNIVLLDVRNAGERSSQTIKGSIHIPLPQLSSRTDELKKFQNKEIVCFCATGSRSLSAALKLKRSGFIVANLKGGMLQWNSAGLR
jgi:rhodanese-related sulfurtransferase